MASEERLRTVRELLTPPPEDWREAVCRPQERAGGHIDADDWNEIVRRRTDERQRS